MSTLTEKLSALDTGFRQNAPAPLRDPVLKARTDFVSTFKPSAVLQPGQPFPDFTLSNAVNEPISYKELLAKGPLLITFYRGEWCPFCNLAMASLQANLPAFTAKGVTLVAICPELPNGNMTMTEKHALEFQVLSDLGNKLAHQLGIVFAQPQSLRPAIKQFGTDMKARNGDDSLEVPVPAAFLVNNKGVVTKSFIEPDYTKRVEPKVVLEWIDEL